MQGYDRFCSFLISVQIAVHILRYLKLRPHLYAENYYNLAWAMSVLFYSLTTSIIQPEPKSKHEGESYQDVSLADGTCKCDCHLQGRN